MTLSFQSKATVPEHVLTRELDGELVILDLHSESYLGLDAVGTRIWQLLASTDSIEAVFEQLLEEYEVEAETLRADLVELLEDLCGRGLVVLDSHV
ncbi:MAG: PqqD family protein [Deltaproteobacteria bacterium]|nr:PqqD family protein [Deltaproteobacteria bacterium]